jgi:hypothetical protein
LDRLRHGLISRLGVIGGVGWVGLRSIAILWALTLAYPLVVFLNTRFVRGPDVWGPYMESLKSSSDWIWLLWLLLVQVILGLGPAQEDREQGLWWQYGTLPVSPWKLLLKRWIGALISCGIFVGMVLVTAFIHDVVLSNVRGDKSLCQILLRPLESSHQGGLFSPWLIPLFAFAGVAAGAVSPSVFGSLGVCFLLCLLGVLVPWGGAVAVVIGLLIYPTSLRARILNRSDSVEDSLWRGLWPQRSGRAHKAITSAQRLDLMQVRCPSPAWRLLRAMGICYGILTGLFLVPAHLIGWIQPHDFVPITVTLHALLVGSMLGALWPDRTDSDWTQQTIALLPVTQAQWYWERMVPWSVGTILIVAFHLIPLNLMVREPSTIALTLAAMLVVTAWMACFSSLDFTRLVAFLLLILIPIGGAVLQVFLSPFQFRVRAENAIFLAWCTIALAAVPLVIHGVIAMASPLRVLSARQRSKWLLPVALLVFVYSWLLVGLPPWHLFLFLVWR